MSVLIQMYSMPGTEMVSFGVNVHTFRRRITTHFSTGIKRCWCNLLLSHSHVCHVFNELWVIWKVQRCAVLWR